VDVKRPSTLALALLLASQVGFAASEEVDGRAEEKTARASEQPRRRTIASIAIVAGRVKIVGGVTYHLVAMVSAAPAMGAQVTDCTDIVFMVNGAQIKSWLPVTREDVGFEIKYWPALALCWLPVPQHGTLELIHGAMFMPSLEGRTPEAVRQEMLKRYEPFLIAVEKIPVVQAGSWDELAAAMGVGPKKEPAKESPAPVAPPPEPAPANEACPLLRDGRMWVAVGLGALLIAGLSVALLRRRRRA
jgi:hypothetical protein